MILFEGELLKLQGANWRSCDGHQKVEAHSTLDHRSCVSPRAQWPKHPRMVQTQGQEIGNGILPWPNSFTVGSWTLCFVSVF